MSITLQLSKMGTRTLLQLTTSEAGIVWGKTLQIAGIHSTFMVDNFRTYSRSEWNRGSGQVWKRKQSSVGCSTF